MEKLRWLHLSDIHFKSNEHYENQKMRDMLVEKLKVIIKDKDIDIIFITGDLSYQCSGYDKSLQKFIEDILRVTSLDKKNLFIVPGNHDIKRNQVRQLVINGTRNDNFIFEKGTLDTLKKGFTQYDTFYKKIIGDNGYFEYKIAYLDDVNIFLLNTALTAGTDTDEGNLVLDKDEFYKVISGLKAEEKKINIAIGHHPIKCFSEDHQKKISHNFTDYNIDLYLCGHTHKAGYDYDLNNERPVQVFNCGAGMVDNYAAVTFLIGDIDILKKSGMITYYKWLEDSECWAVGGAEGRKAADGKVDIELSRFAKEENDKKILVEIDEDEFRKFIMKFHDKISKEGMEDKNINPKDVFKKFSNMKCNQSVSKQYATLSRYFPIIDEIMESSLLSQIEKESIPNIVITEYNKLVGKMSNGSEIMEGIIDSIFHEFGDSFDYSNTTLKTYFKILIYWSIYECDIFNDVL